MKFILEILRKRPLLPVPSPMNKRGVADDGGSSDDEN